MGNTVAARRLRKSMLKEIDTSYVDDIPTFNTTKDYFSEVNVNEKKEEVQKKFKISYRYKVIFKIFCSCLIVCVCIIFKLIFPEFINDNNYVKRLIFEYNKDYSREYLLGKLENYISKIYPNITSILPEDFCLKIKEEYYVIKPKVVNFELKENLYAIIYPDQRIETLSKTIGVDNNKTEEIKEIINGIGGGEPIEIKNESSSVSMMQDDVASILSKNINIIVPVNGTITSEYGARDEIFSGVNSYHTGIDIANVLGTEIKSATDGIVYKTQNMDKYYGNNIEIEKDGVIFKYAHLSEIKVNEGDKIKQGDIIGLMGSTGMSTGSHLHFEIIIDSRTVDPRRLVNF